MLGPREPVRFLEVLLPRLAPLRQNSSVLADSTRTQSEQSNAALQIFTDLCACFRAFEAVDLPNILGKRQRIVCNQVEDSSWLVSVGLSLDQTLDKYELAWPPPDQDPPSIVADLMSMYDQALLDRQTYRTLPSADLAEALRPVGERACQLAQDWPVGGGAGDDLLDSGFEFAIRASSIQERLGLIANLAQALTLPTALLVVGSDAAHLISNIESVMQVIGNDALGMTVELIRELGVQRPWVWTRKQTKADLDRPLRHDGPKITFG